MFLLGCGGSQKPELELNTEQMSEDNLVIDVEQPTTEAKFRPVVVAPSYNNDRTVIKVLQELRDRGYPIIVINDGCTDKTGELLAQWSAGKDDVTVITHEVNLGKAAGLKNGFKEARSQGYTHVISTDTDDQLDPDDIPPLLEKARANPDELIIGSRNTDAEGYPAKNMIGRKFSSLFIRVETGKRIDDSQCGLRVYPLEIVEQVKCRADRFGFETEILTRAIWAGFKVTSVPIKGKYHADPELRISHYRPWMDTLRLTRLHTRLMFRALSPWPHRKVKVKKDSGLSRWERFKRWIDPRKAWEELSGTSEDRGSLAVGLGLGAFIANTPLYGLHAIIGLYVAKKLSIHPLAVVAGTTLSTPPIGPVLITLAFVVGHFTLHGSMAEIPDFENSFAGYVSLLKQGFIEWCIGGFIVGVVCMVLTFFVALMVLKRIPAHSTELEHVVETEQAEN